MICGSVVLSGADTVFEQIDVKHPVQVGFNLPMLAHDAQGLLWREQLGRHVVAHMGFGLVSACCDTNEADMVFHASCAGRHNFSFAPFNPGMVFFE